MISVKNNSVYSLTPSLFVRYFPLFPFRVLPVSVHLYIAVSILRNRVLIIFLLPRLHIRTQKHRYPQPYPRLSVAFVSIILSFAASLLRIYGRQYLYILFLSFRSSSVIPCSFILCSHNSKYLRGSE